MIEHIDEKLRIWGEWAADGGPGRKLGYPRESVEHRLRRTAAPKRKHELTPWYCDHCNHRMTRYNKPSTCTSCGHGRFTQRDNYVRGVEARKTKKREDRIPDNPVAEEIDAALAQLPADGPDLRDVARIRYAAGFGNEAAAKMMRVSPKTFKHRVDMLHYWLDAYLKRPVETG